MTAWIESHQSLAKHPKLLRLMAEMRWNRAEAIGYLHLLWWWCLDYSPEGLLSLSQGSSITQASGLRALPKVFASLVRVGLADQTDLGPSVIRIHDWADYGGKLASQREMKKERDRKAQAARRQRLVSADVSTDVNSRQRSTQHNTTEEERIVPPTPHDVSADAMPATPTDSMVCYGCEQTVDTMDYKRQHKPDCDYFGLYPLEIRARRGMLNERAKREAKKAEPVSP